MFRLTPIPLALLFAMCLAACVDTSPTVFNPGVTLSEKISPVTPSDTAIGPVLARTYDGTVQALWADQNILYRRVSYDGGETFYPPVDQPGEPLLDVNSLGNITAGAGQPRPFSAVVDPDGDLHLILQISEPSPGFSSSVASEIYYYRVGTFSTPTDKAFLIGGRDAVGSPVNRTSVYDPRTREWEPQPRRSFAVPLICTGENTDQDGDGITDFNDNCPGTYNPDQADGDGDSWGDVCDNCPVTPNPGQHDIDTTSPITSDGIGNACDTCINNDPTCDIDGDGTVDYADNCPIDANPEQVDRNLNGLGDACDPDQGTDPFPRWGHAATKLGGRIYKTGGENALGTFKTTQVFDPAVGAWLEEANMAESRTDHASTTDGNYLYVLGGAHVVDLGGGPVRSRLNTIERLDPAAGFSYTLTSLGTVIACRPPVVPPWATETATLSTARDHLAAVTVVNPVTGSSELHVIGGDTGAGPVTTVDSFQMAPDGTLTPLGPAAKVPNLPVPLARHQAVAVGDEIYVVGGTADGFGASNKAYKYRVGSGDPAWVSVPVPMPRPRQDHAAVVSNGKIYLLGGRGDPSASSPDSPIPLVDVYDPNTGKWSTDPESYFPFAANQATAAVLPEPSAPLNLSRQRGSVGQARMAMDPATRDIYVIWRKENEIIQYQPTPDGGSEPVTVQVSDVFLSRASGTTYTFLDQPVRLSGLSFLAMFNNNHSNHPNLAVGSDGTVHVTWIETGEVNLSSPDPPDVYYTQCQPGSGNDIACLTPLDRLASPTHFYRPVGEPPSDQLASPQVAVDDVGNVFLAWIDRDGSTPIYTRDRREVYTQNVFVSRFTGIYPEYFTPPVPVGIPPIARPDDVFVNGPPPADLDPQKELADLASHTHSPTLIAQGDGQLSLIWANNNEVLDHKGEIRFRRSLNGGRSFLDEADLAGGLMFNTVRNAPDLVLEPQNQTLVALWQEFEGTTDPLTGAVSLLTTVQTRALNLPD